MDTENLIYVLDKSLALYQVPDGFRTSMDSIMLGAACPVKSGQSVLDLGCGVGSAGLCVLKRVDNTRLTGIDIQQDHIDLAIKNSEINHMQDCAEFICTDIRDDFNIGTFDHVICNPPYKEAGAHRLSPSPAKARAMGHIEDDIDLQNWITRAWLHIKGQGSLTIIHEAGQVDNILHSLYGKNGGKRFGRVEIIPLYPKQDVPAKRVILRAYKHKKSPAILHHGIIMHDSEGNNTKQAENILRNKAALCPRNY